MSIELDSSDSGSDDGGGQQAQFKLVLLGESGTGKTSLVMQFVRGEFYDFQDPTIGATFVFSSLPDSRSFMSHTVTVDRNRRVKFEIWDTGLLSAGQERFRSLIPMYYRQASAALVLYDLTNPSSFHLARQWVKEIKRQSENRNIVICLCGNKSDLPNHTVSSTDAQTFSEQNDLLFSETSAKTGQGVADTFLRIAQKLSDREDIWNERRERVKSQERNLDLEFERQWNLSRRNQGGGGGGGGGGGVMGSSSPSAAVLTSPSRSAGEVVEDDDFEDEFGGCCG